MKQESFIAEQMRLIAKHWPQVGPRARRLARSILPDMRALVTTLVILAAVLFAQSAGALSLGAPGVAPTSTTMSYQGRLADSSGNPVSSAGVAMQFRLYNVNVGGSPLWSETQAAVPVEGGLFHVLLGSTTPIPVALLASNNALWLGITVGADSEMTPREPLASVPYAMVAQTLAGGVTANSLNLQAKSVHLTQQFTTSSASYVDIPGSDISVTTANSATLMVSFTGNLFALMQANSSASASLIIGVDGVDRPDLVNQGLNLWSGSCCVPNAGIVPAGFTALVPVGSGTHTVKLRVAGNSYDPNYRHWGINYNNVNSTFSVIVFGP